MKHLPTLCCISGAILRKMLILCFFDFELFEIEFIRQISEDVIRALFFTSLHYVTTENDSFTLPSPTT